MNFSVAWTADRHLTNGYVKLIEAVKIKTIKILAAIVCAAVGGVFGQEQELSPSTALHATATRTLTVPGFSFWGLAQCDRHGNLFFRIGDEPNRTTILRFSSDGENHSVFTLPSDFAEDTAYIDFRVNSEGEVQVLVNHRDGGLLLFFFKHDSTTSTHTRLQTPDFLVPSNFVVFPSGTVLISGFYSNDASEKLRGKSFTAEYDSSGRLLRVIKHEFEDPDPEKKLAKLAAIPTMDEKGFLYLVDGEKILVISESGRIERQYSVTKPAPEFTIERIQVAEGHLAVWFVKNQSRHRLILRIGIYDSFTGQRIGLYAPDEELGNNAVCFSGTDLTFFRVRNGVVQLSQASVR